MSGQPQTRYVAVGDADVAYQVSGDGPIDLLFCYGLGSHIEFNSHVPTIAGFQNRLASFSRLITFDRRGTGASDGIPRNTVPTLEERTEDADGWPEASQAGSPVGGHGVPICWYWRADADGVATWGPTSRPVPQWTRPGATPVETLGRQGEHH
jgi:pimeloyl-ACP methyl ester carboxylesterase